jgi:ribonuclease P/MRP protein subunit RPP25
MDNRSPRNTDNNSASEMRVSSQGKIGNYLIYANALVESQGFVVIKATGGALTKAITVAELMKRRHAGLHQITEVETVQFFDEYQPREEGAAKITEKRWKAAITLKLSKTPLDTTHVGYQAPSTSELPSFRPPSRRSPAVAGDVTDSRPPRRDVGDDRRPPYVGRRENDYDNRRSATDRYQPRSDRAGPREYFDRSDRFADRGGDRRGDERRFDDRRGQDRSYNLPERRVPFGGIRDRPASAAYGERRPFADQQQPKEDWPYRGERSYTSRATGERSYGNSYGGSGSRPAYNNNDTTTSRTGGSNTRFVSRRH